MSDITTQVLIDIRDEVRGLRGEVVELRDEVRGLRGEVVELRGEVVELRGELTKTNERLDRLHHRQVEGEIRLSTQLGSLIGSVEKLRDASV